MTCYMMEFEPEWKKLHGYGINADKALNFALKLSGMNNATVRKKYGLNHKRSQYLPVSCTLLHMIIAHLKPSRVIVSTSGLRDGLLHEIVQQN